MKSVRHRVWELVSVAKPGDQASRAVDVTIVTLILLSVGSLMLSTVEGLAEDAGTVFFAVESVVVFVFTAEYAARLWSCVEKPGFEKPVTGRMRFAVRPMMIVDLVAVLPSLMWFLGLDLIVLRLFRLAWFARLTKLGRYSEATRSFVRVLQRTAPDLGMTVVMLTLALVVSATLMYFAEQEAQPEKFGSIPDAMWWAVVTLTTVGYGDTVPVTGAGRVLGGVIVLVGVGFVSVPTALLSAAYADEMRARRGEAEG